MMNNSEPLSAFPSETAHESPRVSKNQRRDECATPVQPIETTIENDGDLNLEEIPDVALPDEPNRRNLAAEGRERVVSNPVAANENARRMEPSRHADGIRGTILISRGWKVVCSLSRLLAVESPSAGIAALAVIAGFSVLFLQPVGNMSVIVSSPPPPVFRGSPPAARVVTQRPPGTRPHQAKRAEGFLRHASLPVTPFGTRQFNGVVAIESEPSGAAVFVNQRPIGVTPLRVRLPANSYAVWVERAGYQRWTAGITVPADKLTRVAVKLQPDPHAEYFPR